MHLLPAERSGHRVIDGERVCQAIAVTGFNDTAVSQTLRYPRAAEVVTAERDGRVIGCRTAGGPVAVLLGR